MISKRQALLLIVAGVLAAGATSCANVGTALIGDLIEPGEVGFLIDLYGGDRGIQNAEIKESGKQQYNTQTQKLVIFPTTLRSYPFTAAIGEGDPKNEEVSATVQNVRIGMDVGVTYGFNTAQMPGKKQGYTWLHEFYSRYKLTPEQFREGLLYQGLRDCAQATVEAQNVTDVIALQNNPIKFLTGAKGVKQCLQAKFPEINLSDLNILGTVRIPEAQQKAAEAVSLAKQTAEQAKFQQAQVIAEGKTAVTKAQAEADAKVTTAKGEAKALEIAADSLTPAAVKLKQLEIQKTLAERWLPTTVQGSNVQVGGQPAATPAQ